MQKQNSHSADQLLANLGTSLVALDLLCLFVAPLAGGAGNYMALFFSANLHWGPGKIGVLLAVMSISLAMAQIPAGVLVDKVFKFKRIIIGALSLLTLSWLIILLNPVFYTAMAAQALIGATCAVFMPAMASISLGLVGLKKFDERLGRNGVFSHTGNVFMAVLAAFAIARAGSRSLLVLFVVFALLAIAAIMNIDGRSIEYSHIGKKTEQRLIRSFFGGFANLLGSRTSILFTIAALFYTFADAAMLPLMVQRIASIGSKVSSSHVPIAFFLTELVMIPVCYIAGKRARLGRKPLLLISYAFLFIRGLCFSLISNPDILVGLQMLDGISAGIFGLMLTLVISDLSIGTGRFNATLTTMGMLFTLVNSVSSLGFGFTTGKFGYPVAFSIMAACAAFGGILLWMLVPETVKTKLVENPT
jgi:MFS family permease